MPKVIKRRLSRIDIDSSSSMLQRLPKASPVAPAASSVKPQPEPGMKLESIGEIGNAFTLGPLKLARRLADLKRRFPRTIARYAQPVTPHSRHSTGMLCAQYRKEDPAVVQARMARKASRRVLSGMKKTAGLRLKDGEFHEDTTMHDVSSCGFSDMERERERKEFRRALDGMKKTVEIADGSSDFLSLMRAALGDLAEGFENCLRSQFLALKVGLRLKDGEFHEDTTMHDVSSCGFSAMEREKKRKEFPRALDGMKKTVEIGDGSSDFFSLLTLDFGQEVACSWKCCGDPDFMAEFSGLNLRLIEVNDEGPNS